MKAVLIAATALMTCAGAAYAQNNTSSTSTTSSASDASGMNNAPIREQVKDNLQKAGFQDVTVTPASFMVHAKNKNGQPVAMVVTPDSVTMVTEVAPNNGTSESGNSTGSSSQKTTNQ